MRSKEVGNAQSVRETFDIFLTLPPTFPGQKNCAVVFTHISVANSPKMSGC